MKDKDAQLMMEAYREDFGTAPAPQDDELASYVSPDSTKLNQTLQDIGDKLYDELLGCAGMPCALGTNRRLS